MEEERLAFPYNLWMWQRAHDFYNGLSADDRKAVDTVLNNEQAQALSEVTGWSGYRIMLTGARLSWHRSFW